MPCVICEKPARGSHFGVVSCRACAVFFRRALFARKLRKPCKFDGSCRIFDGSQYSCKSCRLEKCKEAGMTGEGLKDLQKSIHSVPRPSLVILLPKNSSSIRKTYINVNQLVDQGWSILKTQSATPWKTDSQLSKLTIGSEKFMRFPRPKCLSKVTNKDAVEMWSYDFLSSATWLTHFDEFRVLPSSVQMKFLQCIWHVWGRLHKLVLTTSLKKSQKHLENEQVISRGGTYINMKDVDIEMSWLSSYPAHQIFMFMVYLDGKFEFDPIIKSLEKLDPTDVELTFMFAHLCFEYAGNRCMGEIREISDRFMARLSNDLHDYYYEQCAGTPKKSVQYAGRLAQMMKVNAEVQQSIRRFREKTHIARTFDIFTAEYSHPEMFQDTGC